MKNSLLVELTCAASLLAAPPVFAHHAFNGTFDMSSVVQVDGVVTELRWSNPHVRFSVQALDGTLWSIESNSVSILRRMDVSPEIIAVGDRVRVAGGPAIDGSPKMFSNNVLLADGRELVLRPGNPRIWSDAEAITTSQLWLADGTASSDGIFRVWSTLFVGESRNLWNTSYPLTDEARKTRDSFDPIASPLIADCSPKGMPWIMEEPYPIEFSLDGKDIVFRLEEFDTVRTIHMDDESAFAQPPSRLGNSVGHWENDTLVVETRGIDWPFFNATGIPQSAAVEMTERFKVSDDGSRLEYELTVVDPATFTEPVLLDKQWIWRPGEQVRRYDCTPAEQ